MWSASKYICWHIASKLSLFKQSLQTLNSLISTTICNNLINSLNFIDKIIVIISVVDHDSFLVRFSSTFNRNVAYFFFATSIFRRFNLVRMVSGYTCICMIHGDEWLFGAKKDEVSGENIPCFNYLYFNSLPAPTANLIPWIKSAEDYFFNLRAVFIGNETPGRARCRYKAFLIAASRMQISIPHYLPISDQKVYIKRRLFSFSRLLGKHCSKI